MTHNKEEHYKIATKNKMLNDEIKIGSNIKAISINNDSKVIIGYLKNIIYSDRYSKLIYRIKLKDNAYIKNISVIKYDILYDDREEIILNNMMVRKRRSKKLILFENLLNAIKLVD